MACSRVNFTYLIHEKTTGPQQEKKTQFYSPHSPKEIFNLITFYVTVFTICTKILETYEVITSHTSIQGFHMSLRIKTKFVNKKPS